MKQHKTGDAAMVRTFAFIKKFYLVCFGIILFTTLCILFESFESKSVNYEYIVVNWTKYEMVKDWLSKRRKLTGLSKLGRILFLDEEPEVQTGRNYKILVWKYGKYLENRHLKSYSNKLINPFEICPVKNCDITQNDDDVNYADIVIFHLQRMKGLEDLPKTSRNPSQIWAFLTDESPFHTFLKGGLKLSKFNGVFNWSMTYRKDSDIPVPYGRVVLKKHPEIVEVSYKKKRDVLVAIMGSNCGGKNDRWEYVKELQKHIKVDVYGACGPLRNCPGHFKADCPAIDSYMFYLAFENSNCDDYMTEKLWWNAFAKNSIPIVMGASPDNYELLLPPKSYINVDDFANPAVLAQFINHLNQTEEYKAYWEWKKYFDISNEHAYFQSKSYHFCRVCQALNYNDKSVKVYEDLDKFWNAKKDCHPSWKEWKQ